MATIEPALAPVRPRVTLPDSDEPVLLEDEIRSRLENRDFTPIRLVGPPGSGKSTALAHLASVFIAHPRLVLHDISEQFDPAFFEATAPSGKLAVVASPRTTAPATKAVTLMVAGWTTDELIEYLLVVHHERCATVMSRISGDADAVELSGDPELWRIVLDRMAEDDAVTINAALRLHIDRALPLGPDRDRAEYWCLRSIVGRWALDAFRNEFAGAQLLHYRLVQELLAADRLATLLRRGEAGPFLEVKLPYDLVEAVAEQIRGEPAIVQALERMLERRSHAAQPMAASLLHAVGAGWTPRRKRPPLLDGAYLPGAVWPGIQLKRLTAIGADLSSADLRESRLDSACLANAQLVDAQLQGSRLTSLAATRANLSGADLSFVRANDCDFHGAILRGAKLEGALLDYVKLGSADLSNARLTRASLFRADLRGAKLAGADFTAAHLREANLSGLSLHEAKFDAADFTWANLEGSNLETMHLVGARFEHAYLAGAYLTDSRMPDACFRSANLYDAGLAGIDWERADLRDADLRGATFHLGSSRSGLVFSPYACEGSRTGFYTDEFNEQDFKSPEEIRKANLCGADLRGALIDGVDFYLVDLRGARYTFDQEQHLRRCDAILEARV